MDKKLTMRDFLFIGSLVFGLFFGAGNLIFPVHLGQAAGSHVLLANLGFILTGVGLPFLGLLAMALTQSNGVFDLAERISKPFAYGFTIALYLVIGPFFAMPRLATTSFEIGLSPFVTGSQTNLVLMLFSIGFFAMTFILSLKPTKLLDYIGKYLNPCFLILLGILLISTFLNPMGTVKNAPVQDAYQTQSFYKGLQDGYNTLDALASLAFGMLIIENLRNLGIHNAKKTTKAMIKGGSVAVFAMSIIYTSLAFAGTFSIGKFPLSENGGISLAQIAQYHLGTPGLLLLALIVITACFKTSIGLATSVAEAFFKMFPRFSYRTYLIITCLLPAIFANVGLTKIIEISIPVLMFIYPMAIVQILLAILDSKKHLSRNIYQLTMSITTLMALFDGLNAFPDSWTFKSTFTPMLDFATHYVPFFNHGFGWLIPSIIAFIIGLVVYHQQPAKNQTSQS